MSKKTIFLIREIIAITCLILSYALPVNEYIILAIALIGYFVVAYDVIFDCFRNIIHGKIFDESFLMVLATIGAFATKQYSEGLMVMVLFQIGEYFQSYAVNKSRKSIADLMDIRPLYANKVVDDNIIEFDPYDIKIDDIIAVKPGEMIPLDGIVIKGSSYIDSKSLTGESKPIEVTLNDEVLSGTINLDSILYIKVNKEYSDSTVEKILSLIEEASDNKSKSESFISKFAKWYTPVVVILALLLAILPPLIIGDYGLFPDFIRRACSFLVISCPCALVISVPLTYFTGIGCASKNGILVKGSSYLEVLSHVNTICFDKTGTLTKGTFKVTKVIGDNELVKYAAYAEYYSNHPIASAIKEYYQDKIDGNIIIDYKEIPGKGISYKYNSDQVLVGNKLLLEDNNIKVDDIDEIGTLIYVAVNNNYLGSIVISDEIKEEAKLLIEDLNKLKIKSIMLSGDNDKICKDMANRLGITEYYASLLPQDKLQVIEDLTKENKVAFVGDGINDSLALVRSDVGISMGNVGSDAAIEASDIVIVDDNISKISKSLKLSKKVRSIVYQNIIFAIGVKVLVLVLAALGFAPMFLAVFADVGVSAIAILNAMRAFKI